MDKCFGLLISYKHNRSNSHLENDMPNEIEQRTYQSVSNKPYFLFGKKISYWYTFAFKRTRIEVENVKNNLVGKIRSLTDTNSLIDAFTF